MIKTVLTQLTGHPSDNSALETAYVIARLFDAHIEGLHVSPTWSQIATSVAAQTSDSAISPVEVFDAFEREAKNKTWRANRHFAEFCRRWDVPTVETPQGSHRVTAAWRELKGDVQEATVREARFHDLTVVGRAPEPAGIDALILSTGRPIVLAPKQSPENLGPTIAIAWKETAEAARAVTAAMPLLAKSEKIVIIGIEEGKGSEAVIELAGRISQCLRWHGMSAEAHYVVPSGRSVADAILRSAQDNKADLLVMGAYGHSRLRELVLGGVTREVLRECPLPVFLFH